MTHYHERHIILRNKHKRVDARTVYNVHSKIKVSINILRVMIIINAYLPTYRVK